MNTSTNNYPYLELGLIDFIHECPDQFLTTDEVLEYIEEEYGKQEYLDLSKEAEDRFRYTICSNDKKKFSGFMPIEYVRDIILACFFLNSKRLDMNNYKYTTNYTVDSESRRHFNFVSEIDKMNPKDSYYKITNFEPIISSNGSALFAGFIFYTVMDVLGKEVKSIYSRIYGLGSNLTIVDNIKHHSINTEFTGVTGLELDRYML